MVGVVALLAFGPQELPRLVRDSVRFMRRVRALGEAAGHELRRELQLDELDASARHLRSQLDDDLRPLPPRRDPPDAPPPSV